MLLSLSASLLLPPPALLPPVCHVWSTMLSFSTGVAGMIGVEGRRDGAFGYALHALNDVLRAARQFVGCEAFGCGLLGDVGEDFTRRSLGGIESGGSRLARLALDGIAG